MTTWKASQIMTYLEHRLVRNEKFPELNKDEIILILEAIRRAKLSLNEQWRKLPINVQAELLETNKELEEYNLEKEE